MQLTMSSLINSDIKILVILLQILCSSSGQTQNSSGLILYNSLRVSSLTQLLIFPLTNFWNRQYRFTPNSFPWPITRSNSLSTSFCDFSFFWMQERMSRMIFGTTLRFYICFDFLTRLLVPLRGLQSSSQCTFLGRESAREEEALRCVSVEEGQSTGRGLRMMVSTTDSFPS